MVPIPNLPGNEDILNNTPLPLFISDTIHEFDIHDYTNFCMDAVPLQNSSVNKYNLNQCGYVENPHHR